jgi:hypothetical protein
MSLPSSSLKSTDFWVVIPCVWRKLDISVEHMPPSSDLEFKTRKEQREAGNKQSSACDAI